MNNVNSFPAALAVILATLPACAMQANRPDTNLLSANAQAAASSVSDLQSETRILDTRILDTRAQETVQKLVQFGARVTGTPAAQQASQYLVEEFRKAGYRTELQPFTYPKFRDLGSTIRANGRTIAGQALNNSIAGQAVARVVIVPNAGRPEDFEPINSKGAIALVRRGEIPFSQKAENAAKAGAIAVIIVNSDNSALQGTLIRPATIPAIGVSKREGESLFELFNSAQSITATLNVNTQQQTVTGRNVIAYLPGVAQPRLLLGGHYDSVSGSPGANDNASGTAVVLETARRLANQPLARQVWFVAFDGEEDGLRGSRAFIDSVQPQFLSGLTAMFNFDMVGINDRLLIGGSNSLRSRVKQLNPSVTARGSASSDHASFAAKKVPVLFFYRGSDPNYHSPRDRSTHPKLLNDTIQAALESANQVLQSN
jgi:aminopeptidase YwaD